MKTIINNQEIYLDGFLKDKLDLMKKYKKRDFDVVFLIDGQEGSGKSTLALACAWYLSDGKIGVNNICEGSHDAISKLDKVKDVLIIDEGSLLFSSRDHMKNEQRQLIKILNVIRQKNMILIIVAPSFFELNKYISVHRSKCLLHVYSKGFERGRFAYFNEQKKRILYDIGKKSHHSYSKPNALFRSRFTDFKPPFYKEYLKTKERSLMSALTQAKKPTEQQVKVNLAKSMRKNNPNLTIKQIALAFSVTERTIFTWFKENKKEIEGVSSYEG